MIHGIFKNIFCKVYPRISSLIYGWWQRARKRPSERIKYSREELFKFKEVRSVNCMEWKYSGSFRGLYLTVNRFILCLIIPNSMSDLMDCCPVVDQTVFEFHFISSNGKFLLAVGISILCFSVRFLKMLHRTYWMLWHYFLNRSWSQRNQNGELVQQLM